MTAEYYMFNLCLCAATLALLAQATEGLKIIFRWIVLGVAYALWYIIKAAEWLNKKFKALWHGLL